MNTCDFWSAVKTEIDLLRLLVDLHGEFPDRDYLSVYEYISHGEYGVALDAIWFDIQELGASASIEKKSLEVAKNLGVTLG